MATNLVIARVVTIGLCGALLAAPFPGVAAVTAVTTTPATERVAVGRATSLAIRWNVTTNSPGMVVVASNGGQFIAPGGTVIGGTMQALDKTVTGPGATVIPEIVLVPSEVVERARRDGHDHLFYRRSFTDGGAASGEIRLYIGAQRSAAFGVSHIALEFEASNSKAPVVARGTPLRARAALGYTGTGMLRGAWEIAGPNPNPETPEWRVLADVTRVFTGAESVTIASPELPVGESALYLVRLNIAEPKTALTLPTLRYTVTQQ